MFSIVGRRCTEILGTSSLELLFGAIGALAAILTLYLYMKKIRREKPELEIGIIEKDGWRYRNLLYQPYLFVKNKGDKGTSIANVSLGISYEDFELTESGGRGTGHGIYAGIDCCDFLCDGRKGNSVWVGPHETKWIKLSFDLYDILHEYIEGWFMCEFTVEHTHGLATLPRRKIRIPKTTSEALEESRKRKTT